MGGARVWMRVSRTQESPADFRVRVGVDLALRDVALTPERERSWVRSLWDLARAAPDHELGDAPFDERFRVEGTRSVVEGILDGDVRKALLALDDRIPTRLGPSGIEAEGSVPDGSAVRDVAYAVLATAAFLTG
jgi:hypothetical protein